MPDIFSYFSPKKLLPSPPRMVLTKEVLIDSPEPPEECNIFEDVEDNQKTEKRQNISEDEGDVAGILNENYEQDCCSSSDENLSVALLKLESEKVSLDAEIRNKYNKISLEDLEEVVEKIVSASGVDFIGDQRDVVEVSEIYELLKSTATFAKKRLRKIQENSEKKQLRDFDFLERNAGQQQVCVTDFGGNSLEEEVEIEAVDNVIEFLTKSMSPESLSKSLQGSGSGERNSMENQEEQTAVCNTRFNTDAVDFPDVGEDENAVITDILDPELVTRTRNMSSTSEELVNSENPKSPRGVKSRFGQVKNRLSLRRVFKKKSSSDDVHEEIPDKM